MRTQRSPRFATTLAMTLATTVATLALAGCGASEETTGAAASPEQGGTTTAAAAATPAAPDVLQVVAGEWKYGISGSPHAGLVEIDFANAGEVAHDLGLVRVKDGVTLDQVVAALRKGERAAQALMTDPGVEIASAAIAGPHVNQHVTVPLKEGHYVVTSFLPLKGGAPQLSKGMVGEFTVLPATGAAAPQPPSTTGTVELGDSGITLPDGFGDGGTVEVTNTGTKVHDFAVAKLDGQPLPAYFRCVAASFGKGTPLDDCRGTLQGGVTALQPGQSAYLQLVLTPGDYGYVSTQGDGADFQAGLNGTLTVK